MNAGIEDFMTEQQLKEFAALLQQNNSALVVAIVRQRAEREQVKRDSQKTFMWGMVCGVGAYALGQVLAFVVGG